MTLCRQPRCSRLVYRKRLCRQHYFYDREQRLRRGETISRQVDPARASAHLSELVRLGHSLRSMSYLSGGLAREVIRRAWQQEGVISSSTEQAILRIPIHQHKPWRDLDDKHLFLAVGTKRRLRALLALGWTQTELGRRCGVPQTAITAIVRGKRERVLVGIVRAVSDLYDEIENETAPTAPTKAVRAYRWPVPAEWDPEDIDDPDRSHDQDSRRSGKLKAPLPHVAEMKGSLVDRMDSHLSHGKGRPRIPAKDQPRVCAVLLRRGHDASVLAGAFRKSREWVLVKAREGGWTPADASGGESGKLQEAS